MLNELRDIARSLKKAGINQEDWHSNFKKCPKYKGFLIFPERGGKLEGLNPVGNEVRLGDIRKWERNLGWSFPVFNVSPLYLATDGAVKKKIAGMKKRIEKNEIISEAEITATIAVCNSLWDENTKTKVEKSLHRTASEVKNMLSEVPAQFRAISDLIGRAEKMDFDTFHEDLKMLAIKGLSAGKIEFLDIVFQGPDNVQLILELNSWAEDGYEYPATHREVQRWMNGMFLAHSQEITGDVSSSTDAFGEVAAGADEQKFPEVRLPIGNVKLRSMFKDIPAQTRYGMIEAESFPAGGKVRKEMKWALEWLSDPGRKGKTWCDLSKNIDKSALLFAYPTEMPESPPELAGLFGSAYEDGADPDGATFSAIAERVTGTLKGRTAGRPANEVQIFVLSKMDKARTKVLVSRRYTAEHTIEAADSWQSGCRNIPPIKIRQFGEKMGDKPVWADCLIPFPAELVWCLNTVWRRQGTYAEAVHGFTINDALSILLDDTTEAQRLAERAIDGIVGNSTPLLLAVKQENIFGKVFKVNQKYAKQPLLLPSILGLLLYKIRYKKGGFMNAPAFLVGQFLRLADQLHLKYCEHVRKGSVPPQLVGNALMSTALEEPIKALSMLSQRILPYQAWANTLREGEDIGLIRYFLGQLGEVSGKLKGLDIPAQCADADKAQMLLGYLANAEKNHD